MNSFLRLPLLATTLLGMAAAGARADAPAYVETAPLSILWNFTITGISGTTIGPKPIVPGAPGSIDPDALRPIDRITTDIGTPIVYSVANGDQAFFTKHLLRKTVERYATEYRNLAIALSEELKPVWEDIQETNDAITAVNNQLGGTVDPDARAALLAARTALQLELRELEAAATLIQQPYISPLADLEDNIAYLNHEVDGRWELTSVREPQDTVAGAASTPFKVFLSRIEYLRGRSPTRTFDTGLRIIPIYSAGKSEETLSNGVLTKATGSYTTHFSLAFSSFFANDPLSSLDADDRSSAVSGVDFNSTGDQWTMSGTGYMSYTIRSTPGPLVAVMPSAIKITGHGTWRHTPPESWVYFEGVAPLSIKMGEIKYQDRHLFPEMNAD